MFRSFYISLVIILLFQVEAKAQGQEIYPAKVNCLPLYQLLSKKTYILRANPYTKVVSLLPSQHLDMRKHQKSIEKFEASLQKIGVKKEISALYDGRIIEEAMNGGELCPGGVPLTYGEVKKQFAHLSVQVKQRISKETEKELTDQFNAWKKSSQEDLATYKQTQQRWGQKLEGQKREWDLALEELENQVTLFAALQFEKPVMEADNSIERLLSFQNEWEKYQRDLQAKSETIQQIILQLQSKSEQFSRLWENTKNQLLQLKEKMKNQDISSASILAGIKGRNEYFSNQVQGTLQAKVREAEGEREKLAKDLELFTLKEDQFQNQVNVLTEGLTKKLLPQQTETQKIVKQAKETQLGLQKALNIFYDYQDFVQEWNKMNQEKGRASEILNEEQQIRETAKNLLDKIDLSRKRPREDHVPELDFTKGSLTAKEVRRRLEGGPVNSNESKEFAEVRDEVKKFLDSLHVTEKLSQRLEVDDLINDKFKKWERINQLFQEMSLMVADGGVPEAISETLMRSLELPFLTPSPYYQNELDQRLAQQEYGNQLMHELESFVQKKKINLGGKQNQQLIQVFDYLVKKDCLKSKDHVITQELFQQITENLNILDSVVSASKAETLGIDHLRSNEIVPHPVVNGMDSRLVAKAITKRKYKTHELASVGAFDPWTQTHIFMHFHERNLDNLIAAKEMKNQHQTLVPGGGSFTPETRAAVEDVMMDIKPEAAYRRDSSNPINKIRPKYAYVHVKEKNVAGMRNGYGSAAGYGYIVANLFHPLKARATYTFSDSLGGMGGYTKNARTFYSNISAGNPAEAQVFGEISFPDDVERFLIYPAQVSQASIDKLKIFGRPIYELREGTTGEAKGKMIFNGINENYTTPQSKAQRILREVRSALRELGEDFNR